MYYIFYFFKSWFNFRKKSAYTHNSDIKSAIAPGRYGVNFFVGILLGYHAGPLPAFCDEALELFLHNYAWGRVSLLCVHGELTKMRNDKQEHSRKE